MTKTEAAQKVRRLEALASGNANEHEAQCAHAIAQKMILRYEIEPGEIPRQTYRPSKLVRSLGALRNHVVKLKMWCLVAQRANEAALEFAALQIEVEKMLEKYEGLSRKPRARNKRSWAGDEHRMQRRYL